MTSPLSCAAPKPLIVHVVYRFDVGGMENGIVNLINYLPDEFADHCVVALTNVAPSFAARLRRKDVQVLAMHKPAGQMLPFLPKLVSLIRTLRPAIFHTRNIGTLEAQLSAWFAGTPVRLHGEHGWDIGDLVGENSKMLWIRRMMKIFVHHQVALSDPTYRYLRDRVGVKEGRLSSICNGVDTSRFFPPDDRSSTRSEIVETDHTARRVIAQDSFVVGAIGRLAAVKNLPMLVDAFADLRRRNKSFRAQGRLAIVGDGPYLIELNRRLSSLGIADVTWVAGARNDIPNCLRAIDVLCLPSLAEGISNAILEAMACGVPVIATDVGGNRELVEDGVTGILVPTNDAPSMSAAIERFYMDASARRAAGAAARSRAVTHFSLESMVTKYHHLYSTQLERAGWPLRIGLDVGHTARSS